jgi:hypothetical protein
MMLKSSQWSSTAVILAGTAFALATGIWGLASRRPAKAETSGFIVESKSGGALAARGAVEGAGGRVTAELPLIDAVAAQLTQRQRQQLAAHTGIRSVFTDAPVELKSALSNVRDNFDRIQWG